MEGRSQPAGLFQSFGKSFGRREGESTSCEELDEFDNSEEYKGQEETEEEIEVRLEDKELERQIAQQKRMLDSLAVSQKAREYRWQADEARRTLDKMQEEISNGQVSRPAT